MIIIMFLIFFSSKLNLLLVLLCKLKYYHLKNTKFKINIIMQSANAFIENEIVNWELVAPGVSRAILAYDDSLMVVKVKFDKDAVGNKHHHVHVQITYVASGVFDVEVGEEKMRLKTGDSFFAPSNVWHGVVCIEAGVLIDTFSPIRQDFLTI